MVQPSSSSLPSLPLILNCTVSGLDALNSTVQAPPYRYQLPLSSRVQRCSRMCLTLTDLSSTPLYSPHHSSVWHTHRETWWTLNSVMCDVNVFGLMLLSSARFFLFFDVRIFCNNVQKKRNWMILLLECSFWLGIPCMFTYWHWLPTGG